MSQDDLVSNYTVSIQYDKRLYKQDIAGSVAHVKMLGRQGIIANTDAQAIISGLEAIQTEIESGVFVWQPKLEDIHMNIESRLHEKIGEVAGKLHTARSRNDQVATDFRLYVKGAALGAAQAVGELMKALVGAAGECQDVVIPAYTHLQRAQPVAFAHHLLAYVEMLERDRQRLLWAAEQADNCPLGSGACVGNQFGINRGKLQEELGFVGIDISSDFIRLQCDREGAGCNC